MRTNLEFRSTAFPACPGEDEESNPGRYGKRLAEFIAAGLPKHGFGVANTSAQDWGWRIDLRSEQFPLWIGCGNYEEHDDGFLCFIEPSRPYVRRWFRRIPTSDTIDRLADALEETLLSAGDVRNLRWWTDDESSRG
jgi:hypothetical protein